MSGAVETRNAIVSLLGAAELSPKPPIEPAYDIISELEKLAGGKILVTCREMASDLLTFAANEERDITIDVSILYKGDDVCPATLDPYLLLAESIVPLLLGQTLTSGAAIVEAAWPEGAFSQKLMEKLRAFVCVLSFTCRFT